MSVGTDIDRGGEGKLGDRADELRREGHFGSSVTQIRSSGVDPFSKNEFVTITENLRAAAQATSSTRFKMPSSITFYCNQRPLRQLVSSLTSGVISIPLHQRPYVWTVKQKEKLIRAILNNFPISSILLRQIHAGFSLEDGRQRLTTARLYSEGHFSVDGRLFAELSPVEQERFLSYQVPVEVYENATPEEAIRIFIDRQGGSPLTVGNRLNALTELSQVVGFTVQMIMTPGQGFHDRCARIWGVHNTQNDTPKQPYLENMTALCMGLAFGPAYITKRWDAMVDNDLLSRTFDDTLVRNRLDRLLRVYEQAQLRQPLAAKELKKQWPIARFSGYIAYAMFSFPEAEHQHVISRFTDFMVAARQDISLLIQLHGDLPKDSWTLARWTNGYNRVFAPEQAQVADDVDSDDTDSD
jgi:hypothetical protein